MDFTLSDEHERMQETLRDFFESAGGTELARRQMEGDDEVVDELWDELVEMDYTALTVPFDYGGLGEGLVYLSAVLEEAGRFAMPGPYLETMGVAVPLIDELGTSEQKERYLSGIVDGDLQFSVGLYGSAQATLPRAIELAAEPTDGGYSLDGTVTLTPYGATVDRVVVPARTRPGDGYDGISLFVVDPSDVDTDRLDALDRTRPMARLQFDDVAVPEDALLGTLHEGGDALVRAIDRYTVGTCAMLVGGASRAVDLSVEHGNEREQYGQPVGHYQAVKHRIADMWIDTQNARSLVYRAAWAVDEEESPARAVSAVKSFCNDRMATLFGDAVWNHGAMGFTWEFDGHIYQKQAKSWENLLGSTRDHRERIATERDF